MRHIFGPVPSRRLGLSLGIDLVPAKTCTYDCVYCQLGRTTKKTVERAAFSSAAEITAELRIALADVKPDYITLSGSGEPTICLHLDSIIDAIQSLTPLPVAVLTNGSLLACPEVRRELTRADLVIPSLDAASPEAFEAVNRPAAGINLETILAGLKEFGAGFPGRIWLEVMLAAGINDSDRELGLIAAVAGEIRAEKIQLNTVERPPAEAYARPLTRDELERSLSYFDGRAEIIAACATPLRAGISDKATAETVLSLLRRRPCTAGDIATGLGLHINVVLKLLTTLKDAGRITARRADDGTDFYRSQAETKAEVDTT